MHLEDALKLYPADRTLAMHDQDTYERQHLAGQVIADSFRKLMAEQLAVLRELAALRANTIEGQSGYSLIRNEDLNGISRMVRDLYLRPIAPLRQLPVG